RPPLPSAGDPITFALAFRTAPRREDAADRRLGRGEDFADGFGGDAGERAAGGGRDERDPGGRRFAEGEGFENAGGGGGGAFEPAVNRGDEHPIKAGGGHAIGEVAGKAPGGFDFVAA